jgi:hypothetical protein
MSIASIRRLGHENADKFGIHGSGIEPDRGGSPRAGSHHSQRELFPCPLVLLVHGIAIASPVLHGISSSVWLGPIDSDRVDVLFPTQVNHHPLRVSGVIFSGEFLGEIRITFPVGLHLSIIQPGKPSNSVPLLRVNPR